jgi:acetyl-CoA carboxylase carboxyltransferase component
MIASQTDFVSPDFASLHAEQYCASLRILDSVANETVQMKLLAWVMGLPAGIDPADAARLVMRAQVATSEAKISAPLMKLIETVAQYPAERLAQLVRGRGRSIVN